MDLFEIKVQAIAESFQKECHKAVEEIIKESNNQNLTVQDCTNVWMFRKLAELQFLLNCLTGK